MGIIFIDESGDLGISIYRGSSKVFVICMLVFQGNLDLENANYQIRKFKHSITKSDNYEVKFNKLNKKERLLFLTYLSSIPFGISYIIWNKTGNFKVRKLSYTEIISKLIIDNLSLIEGSTIYIDNLGYRVFLKELKASLKGIRSKYNLRYKLKFSDSKSNSLIQMVDIVSGSIYKSFQPDKNDAMAYIKIIKNKITRRISI